jgi:hypothetical protein
MTETRFDKSPARVTVDLVAVAKEADARLRAALARLERDTSAPTGAAG